VPLRNRVDPFGDLHAVAARGLLTGNRGCLVDDDGGDSAGCRGDAVRFQISDRLRLDLSDTRITYDYNSQRYFAVEISTISPNNSVLIARTNAPGVDHTVMSNWTATSYTGRPGGFADFHLDPDGLNTPGCLQASAFCPASARVSCLQRELPLAMLSRRPGLSVR
jgi:hypothetical protein